MAFSKHTENHLGQLGEGAGNAVEPGRQRGRKEVDQLCSRISLTCFRAPSGPLLLQEPKVSSKRNREEAVDRKDVLRYHYLLWQQVFSQALVTP